MLDDADVTRVLSVTAHPDDVDFGAAGTIAKWTDAGVEVTYCIITDGDAGGFDPNVARSDIDGELTVSHGLRRDISRVIRQVRPQRMLIQSPERNWERIPASHPDHLAAGEAAIQAVYPDARNPFAHTSLLDDEGLEAWSVSDVWVMAHPTTPHYVDVTDTFDRKIAALRAHESQTGHMPELDSFIRSWGTRNAEVAGFPEGRLAESFFISTMPT